VTNPGLLPTSAIRPDASVRRLLLLATCLLVLRMLIEPSQADGRPGTSPAIDFVYQPPAAAWSAPDPVSATAPVGQDGVWDLLFADEFDGTALDQSRWHTCFWWASTTCSIESNHELQLYTGESALIDGGLLRLRADRQRMAGWNGKPYQYTSGMVMTGGRKGEKPPGFTFTYGYAEARLRVPRGRGLWSAFWLLPVSYQSRPEIDVTEVIGLDTNVQNMHYHYATPSGSRRDPGSTWIGPDFAGEWHTFAVDWRPDAIVWYTDGVERWRFTDRAAISSEPMYVLLNLAVGGDWPGAPDASTPFPSSLDVDYVRIWKRSEAGAASTAPNPADAPSSVASSADGASSGQAQPDASGCQNRPPVNVAVTRQSASRTRVDVASSTNDAVPSNALQAITLNETNNAVVDVVNGADGQTAPATISLPGDPQQARLVVRRVGRGAYSARLTVSDRCGDWPTVVGEGS